MAVGSLWESCGVRHRVDHLPGSDEPEPSVPAGHVGASRADLARRLRELPPNHASAISGRPVPGFAGADSAQALADGGNRAGDRPPDGDKAPDGDEAPDLAEGDGPAPPLWRHIGHFKALWADHVRRWPGDGWPDGRGHEPVAGDRRRPDDPPGSWRGGGDRYLSPDANASAEEVIESLQQCEPAVTALLQGVEQASEYGAVLAGLEHRRKDVDRLKEKIADKMAVKPGSGPADVASGIADAVRYTFCFRDENYVRGYGDVHQRLVASGCELVYRRNHWLNDGQYKGVNCRWKAPDGHLFELQFHTAESYFAKENLTHPAYRRARRPATSRAELLALTAFQREVCKMLTVPAGISGVADLNVRQ